MFIQHQISHGEQILGANSCLKQYTHARVILTRLRAWVTSYQFHVRLPLCHAPCANQQLSKVQTRPHVPPSHLPPPKLRRLCRGKLMLPNKTRQRRICLQTRCLYRGWTPAARSTKRELRSATALRWPPSTFQREKREAPPGLVVLRRNQPVLLRG